MTAKSNILAALLLVQLIVAGGLLYASHSKKVTRPDGLLLEFDPASIDKVEIADGENDAVVLSKSGGDWQLPDNGNVPANSEKLDTLVTAMSELQTGWAVATKPSSHVQLEVADDQHQRRVKLYAGGAVIGDIYVGTSPGLRRVHARAVDSDEVYAVALNSYDVPASTSDWLQSDLLAAKAITALDIADAKLSKQDDAWQISIGDGEPAAADDGVVAALTGAIERLRVQDVAAQMPDGAEPVSLSVTTEAGELQYQLVESGEDYFATRSDVEGVFAIQKSDYESIANVSVDELKAQVESESEQAQESESEQAQESEPATEPEPAATTEPAATQEPAVSQDSEAKE